MTNLYRMNSGWAKNEILAALKFSIRRTRQLTGGNALLDHAKTLQVCFSPSSLALNDAPQGLWWEGVREGVTVSCHASSISMPVAAMTPAGAGVRETVVGEAVDKFARCDVAQLAVVDGHATRSRLHAARKILPHLAEGPREVARLLR